MADRQGGAASRGLRRNKPFGRGSDGQANDEAAAHNEAAPRASGREADDRV
jgi:hypothetical protein